MELSYIRDAVLRQRIEDSIDFMYALYKQTKETEISELYRAETYRVIIIYIVSVIEAVLFDIYAQRGHRISKIEYKKRYG